MQVRYWCHTILSGGGDETLEIPECGRSIDRSIDRSLPIPSLRVVRRRGCVTGRRRGSSGRCRTGGIAHNQNDRIAPQEHLGHVPILVDGSSSCPTFPPLGCFCPHLFHVFEESVKVKMNVDVGRDRRRPRVKQTGN